MHRTTKIIGFSVPLAVVQEVEDFARAEGRTKSELFREMVRVYRRYREQRDQDEERLVNRMIEEAKAEQAERPMTETELLKESKQLSRYGAGRAKTLGIKPKDVDRLIHDHRKARKA